jgi:hypothetical protein
MNINPGMAATFASKNLGDLSKNIPAVKELLLAILKAVESVGGHKVTGRKQGVSCLLLFIYHLVFSLIFLLFFTFVQLPWTQVADKLFKWGTAWEQYKWPQKIYDFKNKVVSAMKAHYERASAPGSHSTSNDPGDHEDLSELDQLCLRLFAEFQEALEIQEAIKRDNLLDKENVANASQF